jgi:hypothetical protein
VHPDRYCTSIEPAVEEPVRRRRLRGLALLALDLSAFLLGDPAAGAVEVGELDAFKEAEQGEAWSFPLVVDA